jgi:Cu/Ag efflux pump CusA
MEALITTPMEADLLNGVSWVKEIRSESIPGLSSILVFENGTDIMRARQMVQEKAARNNRAAEHLDTARHGQKGAFRIFLHFCHMDMHI